MDDAADAIDNMATFGEPAAADGEVVNGHLLHALPLPDTCAASELPGAALAATAVHVSAGGTLFVASSGALIPPGTVDLLSAALTSGCDAALPLVVTCAAAMSARPDAAPKRSAAAAPVVAGSALSVYEDAQQRELPQAQAMQLMSVAHLQAYPQMPGASGLLSWALCCWAQGFAVVLLGFICPLFCFSYPNPS